jgi:hypothetical protein
VIVPAERFPDVKGGTECDAPFNNWHGPISSPLYHVAHQDRGELHTPFVLAVSGAKSATYPPPSSRSRGR